MRDLRSGGPPLKPGDRLGDVFQFERLGYFVADAGDSKEQAPVFNRIVTLRDSWAKQEKAAMQAYLQDRANELESDAISPWAELIQTFFLSNEFQFID